MCRDAVAPSVAGMSDRTAAPVRTPARAAAGRGARWRMTRGTRRAVLALHLLTAVGWMGLDLALGVLALTGWVTDDGATAAGAYAAVAIVVPVVVPALALGMLATGVLLGLGTKWGVLQWTWVAAKLAIGVLLNVLVLVLLLPMALGLPAGLEGSADQVRAAVGDASRALVFPPLVSFVLLAVALVLSLWKPGGRTPWARRAQG